MLKKIFSALLLAAMVCTLGGYEIRKNETVVPDGDLSDWKNIPFQRIAGERFSSDPLRYKGVHDAATESFTSKLTFDKGTICYVGVSTTNQKKYDTEYQITAGILA